MYKTFFASLAILATAFTGGAVQAQDAAGTTTATEESGFASFQKATSFTYAGEFLGPAIADPISTKNPTNDPNTQDQVLLYNSVGFGYRLTENTKVYLNPRFNLRFMALKDVFQLLNGRVGISHKKVLSVGALNVAGNITVELPTTTAAFDRNFVAGPGSYQLVTYAIPGTRWTLGNESAIRGYFYGAGGDHAGLAIHVLASPFVSFQVTPTVAALFSYYGEGGFARDSFAYSSTAPTAFRAGASIDVIKGLNLNPFIQILPAASQNVLNTASVGMVIDGTLW